MSAEVVFLDTVGILAALNKVDRWHLEARPVWEDLGRRAVRPVTTSLVLAECANAVARLAIRDRICDLAEQLEARSCIVYPGQSDWNEAWQAYRRGSAGDAGLVDHVSFVVMKRLGILQAFTNDRHFPAAGFQNLF